eukprot:TRINITY_DN7654_c0_g2_i1.p1 TRINITY_DN7654_c0_g2~~TRINITY_DN7654_c0_g2_i1.p1  ORF type:complete len:319 (+),score=30.39 TRINITY_DN7654_c0_g2_i1:113-958(+)
MKTKTEITNVDTLVAPWVTLAGQLTNECKYTVTGCSYEQDALLGATTAASCINAIEEKPDGTILLNRTTLQQFGFSFSSPFDVVVLSLSLVRVNNTSQRVAYNDCVENYWEGQDLLVVPVGDQKAASALDGDETVNLKKLGVPTFVGAGQKGQLTFSVEQEVPISGPVSNTTKFSFTQFQKHPKEKIEIYILASSFTITRVVHSKGQSLVDLMGGIFGWIGVLTGACMHSLFSTVVDFCDKRAEERRTKAKQAKTVTEPWVQSVPVAVEKSVSSSHPVFSI